MPIRIGKRGHIMNINIDNFPKTYRGFYWLVIKKFLWYFTAAFILEMLLWGVPMITGPYSMQWRMSIFENAINTDWHRVYTLFTYICCLYVWNIFIRGIFPSMLSGKYGRKVRAYANYLLNYRVYNNDTPFFIDTPAATITTYTDRIVSSMSQLTIESWAKLVGTVFGFVSVCIALTVLNWRFLVIMAIYGVLKVGWQWLSQKKVTKQLVVVQEENAKYSGRKTDSLSNALLVKIFANTEYENNMLYKSAHGLIAKERKQAFLRRFRSVPTNVLWYVLQIINLILCFMFIKEGSLTIPEAVFVVMAMNQLDNAISSLNKVLIDYHEAKTKVKKAYETVVKERIITDKPHARILRSKKPDIVFDNVSFGYGDKQTLKNLSLTVAPNEKVGIVGLSGAGKTTLCNLLMRMYEVDSGAIKIAGLDIRDIKHESLLRNISYVPQDTQLFNRTVMDNIRYAKPHTSDSKVIKVAKQAHIHEKISKLPKSYETLVGNNGYKFSGGERQRISIARALLKDAPILILDEATSAMDSQNELAIQKSLQVAMHNKTALVIAHRLSTLRNMDKIIVLKHGQIVEVGSHKQLIRKKDGVYKKLWSMQTGGFIK